MQIRFYLDDFILLPKFWKLSHPFAGERAKYYDCTWAYAFSWLWFELIIYGISYLKK